ncbi:MAG: hypothetical protein ACREOK_14625 [Gemmatimonadaceae bacterium]
MTMLGSPPDVDNELVQDYRVPGPGTKKTKAKPWLIYRVHLDVEITNPVDWPLLETAIAHENAQEAYDIALRNIPQAKQSDVVKAVIKRSLGLPLLSSAAQPLPVAAPSTVLGSPPDVDHELIKDYRYDGTRMKAPRLVYRIHLDVPIDKSDWKDLRKAMDDKKHHTAYEKVKKNIPAKNRTVSVTDLIAAALNHDPTAAPQKKRAGKMKRKRAK